MRLPEKIASVIFLLGLSLKFFDFPGTTILVTVAVVSLGIYYLLFGFLLFNGILVKNIFRKEAYTGATALKIVLAVLAGYVIAGGVWAVSFTIMRWPGEHIMWHVSIFQCGLLGLVSLLVMLASGSAFARRIFYRALVVSMLLLFFHYVVRVDPLPPNEHRADLERVEEGMHIRQVRAIMGEPDSIFRYSADHPDELRLMYDAPLGASDNIYIFIGNNDSIVRRINGGSKISR